MEKTTGLNFRWGSKVTLLILSMAICCSYMLNPRLQQKASIHGLDVLEYHTVAFNFVEFGTFPTMGFLTSPNEYGFDALASDAAEDYVRCRFEAHGPILYLAKPPLFPLLLAVTYAILGSDLANVYWLNAILFIACCLLICGSAVELSDRHGRVLGIVSVLVFTLTFQDSLSDVLPSILGTTLLALTTYLAIRTFRIGSKLSYLMLGLSFGLILLGKGNLMFIILLTPMFVLAQKGFNRSAFFGISLMVFGAVAMVLPWSVYANSVKDKNISSFNAWRDRVINSEGVCSVDTTDFPSGAKLEMVRRGEHHRTMTRFFSRYANVEGHFLVSNQFSDDELLSVHNNLCVDGHWHPEWPERDTAVYNTRYLEEPALMKIASYYADEPGMLFSIAMKKFERTISGGGKWWLFTSFLYGLLMIISLPSIIKNRVIVGLASFISIVGLGASFVLGSTYLVTYVLVHFLTGVLISLATRDQKVPFIFPIGLLNIYLTIVVFYGDPRFADIIQPLSVLGGLYILYLLVTAFELDALIERRFHQTINK